MAGAMVPAGQGGGGGGGPGGSISLALLIDFIIQRTYHELSVLAELLPRKTDMERKIEIYQFASRTRQLFVRLLALVKWAASVSKVDKSANIMAFLDKQSMIFIETADALSRMARETLVHARLPNFHLPAAVEVLTIGTYSRLPLVIRDKIIPPDPITAIEKKNTLMRLSQVIEYRLATTTLPMQMRKNKIENGRVKFTVDHEFEASLTLMGDGPTVPWSLLDINILVEDKETGDGKNLVHPFQVRYIHELLQSRLRDCDNPLLELYTVLHTFSQSLQLEVLHSQTKRLCQERLGDLIRIEHYTEGRSLTISYWKDLASRELKSDLGYRLTAQVCTSHSGGTDVIGKPLQILHNPPLSTKDSEMAEQSIRSDQLSLEKLLTHTIYMRTRTRLLELKVELQPKLGHQQTDCVVQGSPPVLHLPILSPCLRSEQLLITVDTRTGSLQAHIPQDDPPASLMSELQNTLNSDKIRFEAAIAELRFWITQRRCQKTLQHLPVSVYDKLPLMYPADSPMSRLGKHKFFLRLHKHPNSWVVVEFKEKAKDIDYVCHLVVVKPVPIEENVSTDETSIELPKMYYKVMEVNELDMFLLTHGPCTALESQEVVGTKRKTGSTSGPLEVARDSTPGPCKRSKHPAYLLPDLSHVVALCDERIPFASLASQLTKREILHQGLTVEALGTGLSLKLVSLPPVEGVSREALNDLNRRLLTATIRMQVKGSRAWMMEFLFHGSPLVSVSPTEQGSRFPVYLSYDVTTADDAGRTVDAILQDWAHIANLYAAIRSLANVMQLKEERQHFSVKSYNFKKLILGYGPARMATAAVTWKSHERRFHLGLGCSGQLGSNPHSPLREQLEFFLNKERSCGYLARVLHETYEPLASLAKLPSTLQLGLLSTKPPIPVQTFTVMAHSPTHLRLAYCNLYCLDIHLQSDGQVSIRDGAFSVFDKSKVIEEFGPTQGLKAFLSKYVDETALSRRRSQSEDDHPPSPITMEHTNEPSHFLGHSRSTGAAGASPAGQQRGDLAGLRFQTPLTPSGTSNPHTPASPHMGNISQQQVQPQAQHGFGSSPATSSFSLASPPSLPPGAGVNPSPSMLPHPSPVGPGSAFGIASSPIPNPLHAPSPAGMLPTPSPNPAGMSGGAHNIESSPFPPQSLASPAPNTWPGSPGMPRPSPARPGGPPSAAASHHSPHGGHSGSAGGGFGGSFVSRVLPQRSWAGAVPTILTHEAFDVLCTPSTLPGEMDETFSAGGMMAPLERFLGCISMRRSLQRIIQDSQDCPSALPITEPGVIAFRCESLHGRVTVNAVHMQSLQLKLSPSGPEYREQWTMEEFQVLERFFEVRVMAIPFKPMAVHAFCRLLNAPHHILRDLVQLMKLELMPNAFGQQTFKWSVQFCLTVPPSAPSIVPIGASSVLTARNKMLFFLYIRRLGMLPEAEGASLVLPLVYDSINNVTQLAERRDAAAGNMGGLGPVAHTASMMLKRFGECSHMMGLQPGECSIYLAVRYLLANLTLPNEPPAMAVGPGNNGVELQQQPNQMVPMGLGSGPGMANMGPGTPINPMQMQAGPMSMGGGLPQQVQTQGQVSMPIHSPYGQAPMSANPMTPVMSMPINNTIGPTMGQGGTGNMQMQ